jgi:hypothetical protein
MNVIKLTNEHKSLIRPLFNYPKFMGTSPDTDYFIEPDYKFDDTYHENFSLTYLSDLKTYHSYGVQDDSGNFLAILGFYESPDDASWYWNTIRTLGNNKKAIRLLLDKAIEHNEANGRFKFYSMFPKRYTGVYRRLAFSSAANERYDYFDEYYVEAKHQCQFNLSWQILYNRVLVPVDTVVRCTFLKQKYRENIYHAGRL